MSTNNDSSSHVRSLAETRQAKLTNIDDGIGGVATHLRPRPLNDDLHSESMILNMGPTHPATHGTVRIVVELSGERILDSDVEVGYLHRGFEKMCETVTYNQVMPYTDRLNYVSPIINNVGWCLTVEKLLGVTVPKRAAYIRVILSEMSRIGDHLTCLAASAMELGAFTVMLYLMQAREYLWELIEEITGARLTISYCRVGGVKADFTPGFLPRVKHALVEVEKHLVRSDKLLSRNRVFMDRTCDTAIITKEEALQYSLSGPVGRSCGVDYDVRRDFPYSCYNEFDFNVPLGTKGDNYDRFLVRIQEIYESIKIIEQASDNIPEGDLNVSDPHITLPPKDEVYSSIDGMINHFELIMYGVKPPKGDVYHAVEGGNGELGFYCVSDGTGKPYKLHVRAPAFIHMGVMSKMIKGANISDVIPSFGMLNMIGGECDR